MEKKVFFFGQFSTKFQGQNSKFSFFDQKIDRNLNYKGKNLIKKMTKKNTF